MPRWNNPKCGFQKGHPDFSSLEGHKRQAKILKEKFKNKKHPQWKGDNVAYSGLHRWLRNHFKKPAKCQKCGEIKRLDWANKTEKYTRDIKNYLALCRECHKKFDENRGFKKSYGS